MSLGITISIKMWLTTSIVNSVFFPVTFWLFVEYHTWNKSNFDGVGTSTFSPHFQTYSTALY